ncbi:MAG: hypothetical protein MJ250_06040 [Alphaproteobacteria bacterium]|nr:hypothetical protein [Alphaproteobacteria bacterium]
MTKHMISNVDFLLKAAFNLPAPKMPEIFDENITELTDEDMECLAAATGMKTNHSKDNSKSSAIS